MENGELRMICSANLSINNNSQLSTLNSQLLKGGVFLQKACGIICEYNPFHNGHKYQIEYAKNTLGMPVVCAMSGGFVQRGEGASMDKNIRAAEALNGGAEIVLEIPFPYCSMTAEKFARAGVTVLSKSGMCSHLLFGSECADVEKLRKIAELLADTQTEIDIQVYQSQNKNISYAKARSAVVSEKLGDEYTGILSNPNDILGIEYIKAIIETGSSLIPVALKRSVNRSEGALGEFASSSKIRELVSAGNTEKASEYVPDGKVLSEMRDNHEFCKIMHLSLMTRKPGELKDICEVSGGNEHALINAAKNSGSYDEMVEAMKSKTLTDAKIRRMILFSFFGVTKDFMEKDVPYTFVLASSASDKAKSLLRICRKEKEIIVARKIGAVKKDEFSSAVFDMSACAEKVLDLSSKRHEGAVNTYQV